MDKYEEGLLASLVAIRSSSEGLFKEAQKSQIYVIGLGMPKLLISTNSLISNLLLHSIHRRQLTLTKNATCTDLAEAKESQIQILEQQTEFGKIQEGLAQDTKTAAEKIDKVADNSELTVETLNEMKSLLEQHKKMREEERRENIEKEKKKEDEQKKLGEVASLTTRSPTRRFPGI